MSLAKKMLLVNEDYLNMLKKFGERSTNEEEKDESHSDKALIASLPKTFQPKGEALLSFLKANGILYDTSQRVTVNGNPIEGSNYMDVLHDLLRYRDVPAPRGFSELAPVLKKVNISREFVPNLERYQYINEQDVSPQPAKRSGAAAAQNSSPLSFLVPQKKKRKGSQTTAKMVKQRKPDREWVSW